MQSWKNICRLFHVLAQFPFTTSERELDYYHQKGECKSHPKVKFFVIVLQNWKKSAVEHSLEKPMLLNFVYLSTTLCPRF